MAKDEIGPNRSVPHGSAEGQPKTKPDRREPSAGRLGSSGTAPVRRAPARLNRSIEDTQSGKPKPALAVALNYRDSDGKPNQRGPRVAATGRGAVAEQIVAIAFAQGVPVREDADLAQILATVDVDAEIPIDALSAVAEILSYLYRINRLAPEAELPADPLRTNQGRGDAT